MCPRNLLGEEEIIGKQMSSNNIHLCRFEYVYVFRLVEIVSIYISDHCNKLTMANAYVLFIRS